MYAKIKIFGDLYVKTGMHIGGSSAFAAIGAVDSPVIRDTRSSLPMIPGSSLKGKMRSLLAKEFNGQVVEPVQRKRKSEEVVCCLQIWFWQMKENCEKPDSRV